MIRELVVISGKGGTGKTSVTASFAHLARRKVIADCDVDAADLHLVLDPVPIETMRFDGGAKAVIDSEKCMCCGVCLKYCRFDAIREDFTVDPISCEGCGVCARFCPHNAIAMVPHQSGQWFISHSCHGPLVHARLGIAEGNSGKLVTIIKKNAREIAAKKGFNLVIVDGSPGTGCPVIATISGAALVLVVTEPTISGIHDLRRVCDLSRHFGVKTAVCINKADINPENTLEIIKYCSDNHLMMAGSIPYDGDVTLAQMAGISVVEYSKGPAARAIRGIWEEIRRAMEDLAGGD